MRALGVGAVLLAASSAQAGDYVVLAAPSDDPGYRAAAQRLASHHGAEILPLDPAAPEKLLPALRRLAPRYVALVMTPQQIELGFQRRFLETATRLDDDPFVDFAFGYLTGATGKEATDFVEACILAGDRSRAAVFGTLACGDRTSREFSATYDLRSSKLSELRGQVTGSETDHDRDFVAGFLPKLSKCSVIELEGHGYPDQVVGALDAKDVTGLRLDGAVVLDVACWTGTTRTWYRSDAQRTSIADVVAPERSMALALLRTGLCGYTAYLCPRPAGPELDRDLMSLIVDGDSLGDARRRDYDKTVLGFLGFGETRMTLAPLAIGAKERADLDAVRDVMLEDATGGVVFGDPALRPFAPQPGQDPIAVASERTDAGIVVTATCPKRSLWLHCNDPTARIGGGPAMKVYARVALGDLLVSDVVVDSVRIGPRDVASRVVWAVEDDHGERFIQLKTIFPRQDSREMGKDDGLSIRLTVRKADGPAKARRAGGDVEPLPKRAGKSGH